MFSANPTVNDITESELICRITRWLGELNPDTPEGIGDDCAVHQPPSGAQQVVTTDALVYKTHFDDSIAADQAGAKLINRNLSDIAAMGGFPDRAVLNLLFGPNLELAWLEHFFQGVRRAATDADLKIVGGDICRLEPNMFASVLTVLGVAENPLTRRSAHIGDTLFVTGELGGSLRQKHASFTPRLTEGQWLAETGHCTAMMDLTDGLAKDLPSLLAEGQSAALNVKAIPIAADGQSAADQSGRPALEHAFSDGEDYELLFSIRSDVSPAEFVQSWSKTFPHLRISHIGQIVKSTDSGRIIDATDGSALPFGQGFEHFRGA